MKLIKIIPITYLPQGHTNQMSGPLSSHQKTKTLYNVRWGKVENIFESTMQVLYVDQLDLRKHGANILRTFSHLKDRGLCFIRKKHLNCYFVFVGEMVHNQPWKVSNYDTSQ